MSFKQSVQLQPLDQHNNSDPIYNLDSNDPNPSAQEQKRKVGMGYLLLLA